MKIKMVRDFPIFVKKFRKAMFFKSGVVLWEVPCFKDGSGVSDDDALDTHVFFERVVDEWKSLLCNLSRCRWDESGKSNQVKKVAYIFESDGDFSMDFFYVVREGVKKWLKTDFKACLAVVVYHIFPDKGRFRFAIFLNPVSLISGSAFQLSQKDVWWQNDYFDCLDGVFYSSLARVSRDCFPENVRHQLPYQPLADETDEVEVYRVFGDTPYRNFFRKASADAIRDLQKSCGLKDLKLVASDG